LPAEVSMIAVGGPAVAAGFFGAAAIAAGLEVCDMSCREEKTIKRISSLRIFAPGVNTCREKQK
jgi:hypothetical protein